MDDRILSELAEINKKMDAIIKLLTSRNGLPHQHAIASSNRTHIQEQIAKAKADIVAKLPTHNYGA